MVSAAVFSLHFLQAWISLPVNAGWVHPRSPPHFVLTKEKKRKNYLLPCFKTVWAPNVCFPLFLPFSEAPLPQGVRPILRIRGTAAAATTTTTPRDPPVLHLLAAISITKVILGNASRIKVKEIYSIKNLGISLKAFLRAKHTRFPF